MVEASSCNYHFLDKHRSYLENMKLCGLEETNFNFKRVSKYRKSEFRKLLDNISKGISNCLNYILKLKIVLEISIFLNKIIIKNIKQIEDCFIQNITLKTSIIDKKFLMYKTEGRFFIIEQ